MLNEKAKEDARKFALKNAMDYGKANLGAVLSKVLASSPELKEGDKGGLCHGRKDRGRCQLHEEVSDLRE